MESILTKNQKKVYGPLIYEEDGVKYKITAEVRYDDECGNGHNSFAITGYIKRRAGNGRWIEDSGGCIHDEIAKHFPELKPYIKWHLCGSDGPIHYYANTLYLAGDKDCWGKRKGEPKAFAKTLFFNEFPVGFKFPKKFIEWVDQNRNEARHGFTVVEVLHPDNGKPGEYQYEPKYTFKGYGTKWHDCPFDGKDEAEQFAKAFRQPFYVTETPTDYSEGKEPELELARSSAIWPEATLEQLQDKKALEQHLEELLVDFKKAVESLGFVF